MDSNLIGAEPPFPRYLFRAWAKNNRSAGTNSFSGFTSVAKSLGSTDSTRIQDMPRAEALAMLSSHIRWSALASTGPSLNSDLVSFSSSFLWTLVFAMHEAASRSHGVELDEVHICVVDTLMVPIDTFVSRADIISKFDFTQDDDHLFRSEFNACEYFAQTEIDLRGRDISTCVSLSELMERGLLTFILSSVRIDTGASCTAVS